MTIRTPFIIGAFAYSLVSLAQVTCITCVDQDTPLTTNVTNLIVNGGFENTNCPPAGGAIGAMTSFCPNSQGYVCNIDNWTCTGGGTNTYACIQNSTYTTVIEGVYAVYFGNYYCQGCPGGDTLCLVDDGCQVTGIPDGWPQHTADYGGTTGISLEQTITGLTPGELYALEFWAGGEYQGMTRGVFAVDVGFGKIYLRQWWTEGVPHPGTRYTIYFLANATSHTVRFTNWGHIVGSASELILDDVKLYLSSEGPAADPCATGTAARAIDTKPMVTHGPDGWVITAPGTTEQELTVHDLTGRVLLRRSFIASLVIPDGTVPSSAWLCTIRDREGHQWSKVVVDVQ